MDATRHVTGRARTTILTLLVILLSGVWERVYERTLAVDGEVQVRTPDQLRLPGVKKAG